MAGGAKPAVLMRVSGRTCKNVGKAGIISRGPEQKEQFAAGANGFPGQKPEALE